MKEHTIAVIPGDGIGREVIPEGVRVLEAVGARHGLRFKWQEFPWSCDWYKAHGKMCPDEAPDILRKFDAVYFGAAGNPAIVPDHISAWGLLINFRRWFDLYVNLRPVRLFEGLPCPLAGRKPGDIDYIVIRENTEGEYGNVNPERTAPSIFEPVHGSAPDIAGKKIANPIGAIWSGALMLEHLGHAQAAADVVRAIERVILEGPHTADMKGKAGTAEVGAAIADAIRNQSKIAA
jgi:isocitrate/isopropylmalate dehydrogenase